MSVFFYYANSKNNKKLDFAQFFLTVHPSPKSKRISADKKLSKKSDTPSPHVIIQHLAYKISQLSIKFSSVELNFEVFNFLQ